MITRRRYAHRARRHRAWLLRTGRMVAVRVETERAA